MRANIKVVSLLQAGTVTTAGRTGDAVDITKFTGPMQVVVTAQPWSTDGSVITGGTLCAQMQTSNDGVVFGHYAAAGTASPYYTGGGASVALTPFDSRGLPQYVRTFVATSDSRTSANVAVVGEYVDSSL
jgi:hypothetical protein